MGPERFDHLLSLVSPHLQTRACRSREVISHGERLAITLRYLATGDSQQSQSYNFRVGRSTVCKIVKEVTGALWQALAPYLKAPESTDEWRAIAQEYDDEWNFPHALGAVDGKHIAIECPRNAGSMYFNYKQFHSIVLLAMCDAKYKFTFVDIGSYGKDNDASILNSCHFFQRFSLGTHNIPEPALCGEHTTLPYTALGDGIFPLSNWLMTPYGGKNLTVEQNVFNYRLSRARRTVENAFGIMSARWRIFRRVIRADIDTVDGIVKACVGLHNYLLMTENANYIPAGFVDSFDNTGKLREGDWRSVCTNMAAPLRGRNRGQNYTCTAKETRDNFCRYVNNEHTLPWQLDHVMSCG